MALGKLDIIIAADTAQIRKDMGSVVNIMQSSTKAMESFAKSAAGAIGGYFAFDIFQSQIQQTLDFADSLNKLSQKTGITADGLYSLSAAAKLSDVSFEDMSKSLGKFSKSIGENSKTFDTLGLSIKNNDGTLKNSFDLLSELSDKFADMPDGASKATLAMQLFGKSGTDIIPLLNSGSEALKEYLGVMDGDTAKASEAFNDSFTRIGNSLSALNIKILKDFSPSMQSMTVDIEDVAKSIKDFSSNSNVNYYETFKTYADDITALGVALYGAPLLLKGTSSALSAISSSTMLAATKIALYGNELESAIAKTHMAKSALAGLSTAFKTFAPTAALFAITEVFLNWDAITGKVYDNLEKISNFKIQEMIDKQTEYIKTLEKRKDNKEDSNGFLAFLGASWSTMDDNTLRFAKQELTVLENQIRKNKEKDNKDNKGNKRNDYGVVDIKEVDAQVKESLRIYSSYYEAIGDKATAWAIKENELREKNKILSEGQINLLLETEKKKYFELNDYKKSYDDIQKEIAKSSMTEFDAGIFQIEEKAKKYKEDGQSRVDIEKYVFNAKMELGIKQLEQETKDAEAREKEVKAQYDKEQDAMLGYYKAVGMESDAFYLEEVMKLQKLADAGILSNSQMLEVWTKDNEKFQDEQFKKSHEWLYDFFDNMDKALDNKLLDGFKTRFKNFGSWLKDLFSSIGDSIFASLSRTLAGSITSSLQGGIVNTFKSYGGFGSASLVGTSLSASDISSIAGLSGSTVTDGMIKTSGGTLIDQASGTVTAQGSDAMSLLSMASGAKTIYGALTDGISGSILSGFNGIGNFLGNAGFGSLGSGISQFGAGFSSPLSFAAESPLAGLYGSGIGSTSTATMAGGMLSSGLIGYGIGSLGDAIFGAQTKAGIGGAAGAAIGSIIPGIGTIIGGIIGSVIGGFFGSTKQTGAGIDILGNASADSANGQYWQSYKKKSWFSSKSWTNTTGFGEAENQAIMQTIGIYDTLLSQLGTYNDLIVAGGRFSNLQEFLDGNVVKSFLTAINPQNLDEIYKSWTDYAAKIDTTITQALATAVSGYTTYGRGFTEWKLGSGTTEQLKFTAEYLQKDFTALASSLGANGVTVDNFLAKYDEAIKANFTQDTITAWASLGDTLMKSTDATVKYKEALDQLNGTTTYSLPVDTMLAKVNNSSSTIDIKQLVTTQTNQNDSVIGLLVQSVKALQEILRVSQFGKTIV